VCIRENNIELATSTAKVVQRYKRKPKKLSSKTQQDNKGNENVMI
jgi:hypothetical protein